MAWSRYNLKDAVTHMYQAHPERFNDLTPELWCAVTAGTRFRRRKEAAKSLRVSVKTLRQRIDDALDILKVDRARVPSQTYWYKGATYPAWCRCGKCNEIRYIAPS